MDVKVPPGFVGRLLLEFKINGDTFYVTDYCSRTICVEEAEKNGQEDTHMSGVISVREDGQYVWVEGEHLFKTYGYRELPNQIVEYFKEWNFPCSTRLKSIPEAAGEVC